MLRLPNVLLLLVVIDERSGADSPYGQTNSNRSGAIAMRNSSGTKKGMRAGRVIPKPKICRESSIASKSKPKLVIHDPFKEDNNMADPIEIKCTAKTNQWQHLYLQMNSNLFFLRFYSNTTKHETVKAARVGELGTKLHTAARYDRPGTLQCPVYLDMVVVHQAFSWAMHGAEIQCCTADTCETVVHTYRVLPQKPEMKVVWSEDVRRVYSAGSLDANCTAPVGTVTSGRIGEITWQLITQNGTHKWTGTVDGSHMVTQDWARVHWFPETSRCLSETDVLDYEDGSCFSIPTPNKTWEDARSACRQMGEGWDLAYIEHRDTYRHLIGSPKILKGKIWIGMSDVDDEDEFIWTNNREVKFEESFGDINVTRVPGNEDDLDCVYLDDAVPKAANCLSKMAFMCKSPSGYAISKNQFDGSNGPKQTSRIRITASKSLDGAVLRCYSWNDYSNAEVRRQLLEKRQRVFVETLPLKFVYRVKPVDMLVDVLRHGDNWTVEANCSAHLGKLNLITWALNLRDGTQVEWRILTNGQVVGPTSSGVPAILVVRMAKDSEEYGNQINSSLLLKLTQTSAKFEGSTLTCYPFDLGALADDFLHDGPFDDLHGSFTIELGLDQDPADKSKSPKESRKGAPASHTAVGAMVLVILVAMVAAAVGFFYRTKNKAIEESLTPKRKVKSLSKISTGSNVDIVRFETSKSSQRLVEEKDEVSLTGESTIIW